MATASHVWAVRDGLRRNAFGWSGIRKTIQRLHEAVDEIERIARTVIWRWQARAQGCCSRSAPRRSIRSTVPVARWAA